MMQLLINKQKVADVLQVAIGYNTDQFDVFIREAQDFDLKPLLCEDFYYDLVAGRLTTPYLELIDGGNYTYNSRTYFFRGLADVLAYFTYARFILKSNYVSTSHGFTTKTTPYSDPMLLDEKRNMYYKYQKEANTLFADLKIYVERNLSTYASWNSCHEDCGTTTNTNSFNTTVIQ